MMRRSPNHGQRRLFLESLETRRLLAGNVSLDFSSSLGLMRVRGNGLANELLITQTSSGLVFTGLNGTTVNGLSTPVTRAGIRNLDIDLGGGADKLGIGNNTAALSALAAGQLPGSLTGADRVSIGGYLNIRGGSDSAADEIGLIVNVQSLLTINTGGGADRIGIAGSILRSVASINATSSDSAADQVALIDTNVIGLLNLSVGNGSDQVLLDGVQGTVGIINLGTDAASNTNLLTIAGTNRDSRFSFLTVIAGNGADYIDVSQLRATSITMLTGNGNDTLSLQNVDADYLFASLGAGNDQATVSDLGGLIGTLDGSLGNLDRLELGDEHVSFFNHFGFEQVAALDNEGESGSPGELTIGGIDPGTFNPVGADLEVVIAGAEWTSDLDALAVFLNGVQLATSQLAIVGDTLTVESLLVEGRNAIEVYGVDAEGLPLSAEFVAWAGTATLNISLVDSQAAPITTEATVALVLSDDNAVTTSALTSTGMVTFTNVPNRTLQVSAVAPGNLTALRTITGNAGNVELTLTGLIAPSAILNNDFSLGLDGWNTGTAPVSLVTHGTTTPVGGGPAAEATPSGAESLERTAPKAAPKLDSTATAGNISKDVDLDLQVKTSGQGPQTVTRTFQIQPGTKQVKVRYKFITSEVPGGYFGSQYNDGYSVLLRSQSGGSVADQQTMNGLGLAAFDASGATDWKELTLTVNAAGDTVQIDATVENVADGAFDSCLLIDSLDEQSLSISSLSLKDIDNTALQYLSVSPHSYFGGNTRVNGKLTITGDEDDTLTNVELEILQNGSVIATGQLAPAAATALLNKPFGTDEKIELTADQLLFQVPSNQGAFNVSWQNGQLLLRVKATAADGETADKEFGNVTILSKYLKTNRYGVRDGAVGGDDWALPSVQGLIEGVAGITVNDFSNMNGGKFSPHSSHNNGRHVDGHFAGYNARNAATAATMISHLNNPVYGSKIQLVYVTYSKTTTNTFWNAIKNVTLADGRKAADVIKPLADHDTHFHWVLSE